MSGGEHKTLKGASRKMELCASSECGNFAVANESVRAGETLVAEQPIAACILPKFFGTHCLHCMKRYLRRRQMTGLVRYATRDRLANFALHINSTSSDFSFPFFSVITAYGCPNCAGVAFCSPVCASIAGATHHRIECKFIDLLVGSGMSILCFIALRMIAQHNDVSVAIAENRRIIRELCSHSQRRKSTDYFQRSVMSAFLLRILQKANYFGRRTSESGMQSGHAPPPSPNGYTQF